VDVLDLLKPRAKKLEQLVDEVRPFLAEQPDMDPAAAAKHLSREIRPALAELATTLDSLEPYDAATLEQGLRSIAEKAGVKAAALIHATRVAVTGRTVSAGLFDVLVLLGRKVTIQRLHRALNYIPSV
jgi:glutamyl-tRNA synthetase